MAKLVPSAKAKVMYEDGAVIDPATDPKVLINDSVHGAQVGAQHVATFLAAKFGFPVPVIETIKDGPGFTIEVK